MSIKSTAYTAFAATEPLGPWEYELRDPRPEDVVIEVHYCGVCHSDVSAYKNEWGFTQYPRVLGHEITGVISAIGSGVVKWKVGDRVAVGVPVGSCRNTQTCRACARNCPQYCPKIIRVTGSKGVDGQPTHGGFGRYVVVDGEYVNRVPPGLPMAEAAPLMCAGITVYSSMAHNGLKQGGKKVGVVGIGGLGHLAVQFAAAWGNEVWAISRHKKKEKFARDLGARGFIATDNANNLVEHDSTFDYVIDTVPDNHDLAPTMKLLALDGVYSMVGLPPSDKGTNIPIFVLYGRRVSLQGSAGGSIEEAQEMLDFCAENKILPVCEMIKENELQEAFERIEKSDIIFRFVLDIKGTTS